MHCHIFYINLNTLCICFLRECVEKLFFYYIVITSRIEPRLIIIKRILTSEFEIFDLKRVKETVTVCIAVWRNKFQVCVVSKG